MSLVTFSLDPVTLKAFGKRFTSDKQRQIRVALADIKREWQALIVSEQQRLQGHWVPLSSKYAKRKTYQFNSAKYPEVKYNSILKRTGRMMDGYVNGIHTDYVDFSVVIPFPYSRSSIDTTINKRAKAHQGVGGRPSRLPIRAFELTPFVEKAFEVVNAAIGSPVTRKRYKGFNR